MLKGGRHTTATKAKMSRSQKARNQVSWNKGMTKDSMDPRMLRNYTPESNCRKSESQKGKLRTDGSYAGKGYTYIY